MRRGRTFIYLALILLLVVVAVAVIWLKFIQPKQSTLQALPTPVEKVNIVVVTQRVLRGDVLDETVLGMIPVPRDLLFEYYFTDLAEVVGRRARLDLDANMLLTMSMVVDKTEQLSTTGSNAALSIPKGMVAISIPISRLSSVSYAPQSGDHVNVIVSLIFVELDTDFQTELPNFSAAVIASGPGVVIGSSTGDTTQASPTNQQNTETSSTDIEPLISKLTVQNISGGPSSVIGKVIKDPDIEGKYYVVPSEKQRPRLISQTLLQDAIVLRVGNFPFTDEKASALAAVATPQPTPTPAGANSQAQPVVVPPSTPDVITLIVTPQDAVTLNYLVYGGAQLTLVLRSAGDDSRVQTEAATLDFLMKQYNIPMPVKLPYGIQPRLDELLQPVLKNDTIPTPAP